LQFDLSGILGKSADEGGYYYGRLNDGQKKLYRVLLSGITSMTKEIKLPSTPINEVSLVFNSLLLDHPLIFFVTSFNQASDLYKQKCIVRPDYKYAKSFVRQHTSYIRDYLRAFDVAMDKSEVDKEIYVHDYCLNNFRYDNSFADHSYSVLGPVLNGTAVCEGISKFVKLALNYLGVTSLVVHGKAKNPAHNDAMELHAWNIVKIEGKTYHLDVTFDMSLKNKANRYDYFNLPDDDIKKEHTLASDLPSCTTAGNDYFSVNSLVTRTPMELEKFIGSCLMHGKKSIMVKLMNVKDTEAIVDTVMTIAQKQYGNMYKCNGMVEVSYNSSQLVFEINFM